MRPGGHDADPVRAVGADRAAAPPPDADAPKRVWRAWARARRRAWAAGPTRAADEAALAAHLEAWAPWRAATAVLTYLAYADEVAPPPVRAGARALTTRTDPEARVLTLHRADGPLERHPRGFLQPAPDAPEVDPEAVGLVLVPGLAFDVRGTRLGYGRGLYDGLLPKLPAGVPRVGIALDACVVARLPREAHDVAVTHLLTPSGLRAVTG